MEIQDKISGIVMTSNELVKNIRQYCRANANPANVKKYQRFFKEGYDAYGLDLKTFDSGVKFLIDDKKLSLQLVMEAAPELIKSGKYEETSFALALFKRLRKEYTKKELKEIEKWFKIGIINWAHADMLAGLIIPAFILDDIVKLDALESWKNGKNKYQRRIAAVTLIDLAKNGYEIKKLLSFIEPLMTDKEREVHQGVGWFLREAWKIDKEPVEKFLLKWKNTAPRLIFQYATEKMSPDEKKRFKKEK
jgi:3-methyladenine DNA glycosylase AlkD